MANDLNFFPPMGTPFSKPLVSASFEKVGGPPDTDVPPTPEQIAAATPVAEAPPTPEQIAAATPVDDKPPTPEQIAAASRIG